MKFLLSTLILASSVITANAQWQQSLGSENLDVQSLLTTSEYDFFGGATGAYRSSDESGTYTFSNSGNDSMGPTRSLTEDGTFIYTCTSQGVFRSSDNGDNWNNYSSGISQGLSHGIISSEENLFLSTLSGVFHSNDHGENWTSAGMSGIDCRSICMVQDSILFVGTQGSGVYKSTDEGQNWTAVNNGLTSENFRAIQASSGTSEYSIDKSKNC